MEHNHCFCPLGLIGQCHFDYLHNLHNCFCGIAPVVTTTTSVLSTTVTPLSASACHAHTDCSGHICPSDKHPYCKFDRYSSTCHCTVCTEHKHCFCPQGLIGQCHFDYIHNVYSCVCGLPPDTTTTVSTSSTSKSVPTTTLQSISVSSKSTTNSTPIPTTQPTTSSITSTSKPTSRMVSNASSSSVSSSASATSPTSISVPSTNPGIQCPTCDESLNCVWNQTCYPEDSCMIRSYRGTKFTTHCSK
ncbi:mucin-2-like, partial [Saccostrea cucullata]|uniref:mucin-2-like n=1 Tax=Saccostrea cuccullata TaxID=36930 RepID=UPI002ED6441D